MFTWECPTCGRELDIAESECPNCSPKKKGSATTLATEPQPAAVPLAASLPPQERPATARRQAAPAASWGLEGKHVAIFILVAVIAIVAAVYLARPDLFRRAAQLQDVPAADGSGDSGSAYLGDIEVAGVRTWYTDDYKPKVSVVVINHGESAQLNVNLRVELRTRQAAVSDTPLASFDIKLDKEIGPREIREFQTDLTAMGTLASLPPWHQLRVDVKPH